MTETAPAAGSAIAAHLCPLCGQPNGCAMEAARASGQPQPPCWCVALTFAPQTLARIPAQARNKACICKACATLPPSS